MTRTAPQGEATRERVVVAGTRDFRVRAAGRSAFWSRVSSGLWEPQSFRVLERFLDPAYSFIDVGAWIGPTALHGAGLARFTYAFEPDPVAYHELQANVGANPSLACRMQLLSIAVAAQSGRVPLYAGGLYWSEGSHFGDSMSGMLSCAAQQPSQLVDALTLDEFMESRGVYDCNFIKMDIEGGEYGVITGAWRRLRDFGMPALYVSFHAPEPRLRESLIVPCLEELQRCYHFFFAGEQIEPIEPLAQAFAVQDWADEDAHSPWSRLERLLGQGLLAANRDW